MPAPPQWRVNALLLIRKLQGKDHFVDSTRDTSY